MRGRDQPGDDAGQPDLRVVMTRVVTIQVLPGVRGGGLIVGCAEFDAVIHLTVGIKNVCSVLLHASSTPSNPMHVTE